MLGLALSAWGLIRGGVDLLESIKATSGYATLLYSNRYVAVALFSSKTLTATVIVVGGGLIFHEQVQYLARTGWKWLRQESISTPAKQLGEPVESSSKDAGRPRTTLVFQEFEQGAARVAGIAVTNNGEGAEFYARFQVAEGVEGAQHGLLFARWAHTDTIKTWIAKGETSHLILARLDKIASPAMPMVQWKVLAVASDHNMIELAANHSSSFIPLIKASDVSISGSVISKPDAENGIQPFKVILEAFRAIDGMPATATSGPPAQSVGSQDPLVYVEIKDEREGTFPKTVFVVTNRGGSVGHKIKIGPMEWPEGSATFKEIDFIPVGGTVEIEPKVETADIHKRKDISHILRNRKRNPLDSEEIHEFPFTVAYQDYASHAFEGRIRIMYAPLRDVIRRSRMESGKTSISAEPTIWVSHDGFKRLS